MTPYGSICAVATPLHAGDDSLDLDAFGRLLDSLLAGGTAAVAVAGSTGEAAALDDAEFSALLAFARERVAGRVPLIGGSGQSSTRATVARTRLARSAGMDVALVAAPAYVRPTQEGMYRHFSTVAEQGGLPVLLYNVPSRTACDLLPETVARLAGHGNIVGIKEAVPDPARMQALLALQRTDFRIYSGDDPTALRALLAGADGVVSVAANVAPAAFADLCARARAGDGAGARELDERLRPLYAALALEPNPIPLKWCLAELGFGSAHLRLPLVELSAAHRARVRAVLDGLGLRRTA